MESTNKPPLKRWHPFGGGKCKSAKTAIDFLPDADEIERSPVPRMAQITMHVLLMAVVSFGLWVSFSELEQVVVAQGRLVNPLPNVVVQPLEMSIVKTIDARTGQVVKKGDILATLDATFAQADESQLRARLESLETQVRGFEQELAGEAVASKAPNSADRQLQASLLLERKANYKAQQMKLLENAAKLHAALATNRRDQSFVASRLKSLKEIETMQEKMVAQRFGAPLQLLEAQQRSKEAERELELVSNREVEIRRDLAALNFERAAFEKGWRQKIMEELLNTMRERDSLKEQMQKADRRSSLVQLTAPVDSVVLEIAKFSEGSIIQPAETFFTLVPLNVKLEAEVQIDAVDVGYIKIGHPVHVKLDAFPYQKHGVIDATVRIISEDAFKKDTANNTAGSAYYMGRMALGSINLINMTDKSRLLPGMTLSVEIVVGKRSVLSYLAWPLTKGLNEAIREP
ncbi:MAG: HlyD family type I secretion periplasmic adaptor subunit [Rhodoferax sp.]|jgi:HlyD family secretion protein|nr:HlyD family type I secretion periplasmic adaptor subunit [Rhodoferax sp.]